MAWTSDVARVHCDVISAETYLENAIGALERIGEHDECRWARAALEYAVAFIQPALGYLERGVSPEVLEQLRGQVMPLERP